jgi:hypothetical protein
MFHSKMKIDKVSDYNPLYNVIGNDYTTTIPDFTVTDEDENDISLGNKKVHVKFSPLLDPLKYMSGGYELTDELFNIPSDVTDKTCHSKICNPYNSAYVDAMFYNLSSSLKTKYKIPHCIEYYGEHNGLKSDLVLNIDDDVEYICESDFFVKNNGTLFMVDCPFIESPKLKPIKISDAIDIGDVDEIGELNLTFNLGDINAKHNIDNSDTLDTNETINLDANTDCSSTSSHTDDECDTASISGSDSTGSDSSDDSICCNAIMKTFPVHAIYIEKCHDTLDSVMENLTCEEWESVVFQISVTLYIYQKTFNFTHNDLHTSNIMYVTTDIEYLYYKIMGRHYKIPTYGKIYKIIDFGRAIYTVNGKVIYSDSFTEDGDAAGQYSFGEIKCSDTEILPNNSFDLCRLGCSIYDVLIDDVEAGEDTGIKSIICGWCMDNDGKNILYKKDGTERYPGFKLYKMISRRVHHHTPENVMSNKIFDRYMISRKLVKNKRMTINVDDIDQ